MAIYKIFPSKTATIYSNLPNKNTGLDEIIEIGQYNNGIEDCVSRSLIQFDTNDLTSVLSKTTGSFSATLKAFVANAASAPLDYKIIANPLTQRWDMGAGKYLDKSASAGVNWNHPDVPQAIAWNGGEWSQTECSQSFSYRDDKDLSMDIKAIVDNWLTINHGLILNSDTAPTNLKYFSGNTHTIYPPCLEIGWDDQNFESGSLEIIANTNVTVSFSNVQEKYKQHSTQTFRLKVRDTYPTRRFQPSSVYLNTKLLPATSYWAIKDVDTEEMIVDFGEHTKISADPQSNYFTVYMNGLQPERYYKFLIKYEVGDDVIIVDQNFNFKVIR